jgi:hypothetical protein
MTDDKRDALYERMEVLIRRLAGDWCTDANGKPFNYAAMNIVIDLDKLKKEEREEQLVDEVASILAGFKPFDGSSYNDQAKKIIAKVRECK